MKKEIQDGAVYRRINNALLRSLTALAQVLYRNATSFARYNTC